MALWGLERRERFGLQRPSICPRLAGQTLPFGATYLPVFSHAAILNGSKHAARGAPHLTTQVSALLLQVSALASVKGIKNTARTAIPEKTSFIPTSRYFSAHCSRQHRLATFGRHFANTRTSIVGQRTAGREVERE
jgi:hypothetical protein